MRIDVNGAPEWFSNILYLDSFNKAYYASILVQHTHNNPIVITFYNLLFKITLPVNSNKAFDDEMKERLNLRKLRRNRLHLWIFLSKNPSIIQFRKRGKPDESIDSGIDNDRKSLNSNDESKNDIEENKDNIDHGHDTENKFLRVNSNTYDERINASEASYNEKNL